jgi:hypothetical protein
MWGKEKKKKKKKKKKERKRRKVWMKVWQTRLACPIRRSEW